MNAQTGPTWTFRSNGASLMVVNFARYETPPQSLRGLGLCCTGFGFQHTVEPCGPRVLGLYAAVLVERGEGWLETRPSGRIGLGGGSLFWLFPTVSHTYAPTAAGWFERWVLFEGEQAATFERLGLLDPRSPVVEVGREPQVGAAFDELHRDFLSGGTATTLLGASSVHRLVALVSSLKARQQIESSHENLAFRQAVQRLERDACADLDLEALVAEAGMAGSTFRRRFHAAMGCGPKEYILRRRLSLAKERLTLTRWDIAAIAFEAGFKDPFYFSRLFKRKEGMSPRLFRQQYWRGGEASE